MTLGELALLANDREGYGATLEVCRCRAGGAGCWLRRDRPAVGHPLTEPTDPRLPPSSTPAPASSRGPHSSEGRGTTLPFELLGAPWLDADRLAADLNALEPPRHPLASGRVHPLARAHPRRRRLLRRPAAPDRPRIFRPVTAALHLIATTRAQLPASFYWREPWAAGSQLPIDLLSGTTRVREAFDAGVPVGRDCRRVGGRPGPIPGRAAGVPAVRLMARTGRGGAVGAVTR